MTDLQNTYRHRAGRGPDDIDVDAMVDEAITGGRRLVRQRRRYVGAASGVVVAAGVAAIAVALTPSGRDGTPAASEPSRPATPTTGASASRSTAPKATPVVLVAAPATPRSAPVSLRLLPAGWKYVGGNNSYAAYARAGDPHAQDAGLFTGKIIVGPYESTEALSKRDFGDKAGRYAAKFGGTGNPSVYVKGSITVDFQFPEGFGITKEQALRMAGTLTIRSVSNPAHG